MLQAEGTGRTIEKAIENALLELKAPREDVDIKILNEGGLFKKAKVLVSISEDVRHKYEKKSEKRAEKKAEEKIEKKTEEPKEIKKEKKQEEKTEKKEIKEEKKEEKKTQKTEKKEKKTIDPVKFLEGLFKAMGKYVQISILEDEIYTTYTVDGEGLGDAIGHRGETLQAITTIFKTVIPNGEKKVLLDIAGYREKRAETLASTARRIANKVAKSGRYFKLEPMNPAERRIIHTALQNDDRVTTLSKGTEPKRYVIIFPKEYKE